MARVLVTGGTGFLGGHVIQQLLAQGHPVRTTVRSPARLAELRERFPDVEVVVADLLSDEGWDAACADCTFVQHVASPMFAARTLEELAGPAVDGSLRVLRAARDAGVQRVVVTSSCGAIYYGHPDTAGPFDESYRTNLESDEMSLYVRSKALADRAVWAFAELEGLDVACIYPTGIFGPALDADTSSSLDIVRRLLSGMPACPDLWFGIVDVRDVAALHLLAMTDPAAAGERFIPTAGPAVPMRAVAEVLRARLGDRARRVPTRRMPDLLVRVGAWFSPDLALLLPLLGKARHTTSDKARRVLGWSPRPWEDAVVATAESLLDLGLVAA